ncbi:MAG: hypothetical protein N3A55_10420 [Methylohalobius sp.]|nr:hypothetical protein [Methylohalobius sp.]
MRIWIWLSLILLSGCAAIPPQRLTSPSETAAEVGTGWWYAAFEFTWPQDQPPAWHRDVMIAHRIIAPVVQAYRSQIRYWRVHRRAARDGAGHRFSFIFYAAPETARAIYAAIDSDPDLAAWRGLIHRVQFDDPSKITRPDVEDTSDPAWPKLIQQTWPAYIMGVSQMWLELVIRLAEELDPETLEEGPYRKVQEALDALWAANASHAFLHHLNAIYAYQPFWTRY